MRFKVGDRVMAIKNYDGLTPKGIGVIKHISETTLNIEFLDWKGGHNGNGFCESPHGYNYQIVDTKEYLKLIVDVKRKEVLNYKIIYNKEGITIGDKEGDSITLSKKDFKKIYEELK